MNKLLIIPAFIMALTDSRASLAEECSQHDNAKITTIAEDSGNNTRFNLMWLGKTTSYIGSIMSATSENGSGRVRLRLGDNSLVSTLSVSCDIGDDDRNSINVISSTKSADKLCIMGTVFSAHREFAGEYPFIIPLTTVFLKNCVVSQVRYVSKNFNPSNTIQTDTALASMTSPRLTGPQEDALLQQVSGCLNMDTSARNAQDMAVDIEIEVNPDRTVARAQIVDKLRARMYADGAYRAVAEAALRAVKNPRCQPLALPPDKYDTWHRITFTFDPRDML